MDYSTEQEFRKIWAALKCKANCFGILPSGVCNEDLFLNQCGNWVEVGGGGGNGWLLTGNSGTDPDVNFIGTIDDVDVNISRNGFPNIVLTMGKSEGETTSIKLKSLEDFTMFQALSKGTNILTSMGDVEGAINNTSLTVNTTDGSIRLAGSQIINARVIAEAGDVNPIITDYVLIINKTVAEATTVNLTTTEPGWTYIIKDGKGDAAINNITITPASGTIDGAASYVINSNYQSVTLIYDGNWHII